MHSRYIAVTIPTQAGPLTGTRRGRRRTSWPRCSRNGSVGPALSTIRNELETIGQLAAQAMTDILDGKEASSQQVPLRLIVRESSSGVRPPGR